MFFCPQHTKPGYFWPFAIFPRTSSNRLFCTALPNRSGGGGGAGEGVLAGVGGKVRGEGPGTSKDRSLKWPGPTGGNGGVGSPAGGAELRE